MSVILYPRSASDSLPTGCLDIDRISLPYKNRNEQLHIRKMLQVNRQLIPPGTIV